MSLRASEEVDIQVGNSTELMEREFSLAANPHPTDTMLDDKALLGRRVMDPLGVVDVAPRDRREENLRFACDASVGKWGAFQASPLPVRHGGRAV